jgi:hypothetical protein
VVTVVSPLDRLIRGYDRVVHLSIRAETRRNMMVAGGTRRGGRRRRTLFDVLFMESAHVAREVIVGASRTDGRG